MVIDYKYHCCTCGAEFETWLKMLLHKPNDSLDHKTVYGSKETCGRRNW